MSPFEKIEAEYAARPREQPFSDYVTWYLRYGFVFSRPDILVIGRAVPRHAPQEKIMDQRDLFHNDVRDCWYIFAAAGNTARMWRIMPWHLPWFCWTRIRDAHSELTFVESERLKRLCPPDLTGIDETS